MIGKILAVVALALAGVAWVQSARVDSLQESLASARASLQVSEDARKQAIDAAGISAATIADISERQDAATRLLVSTIKAENANEPCPISSDFFDRLNELDGSGLLP